MSSFKGFFYWLADAELVQGLRSGWKVVSNVLGSLLRRSIFSRLFLSGVTSILTVRGCSLGGHAKAEGL